jgi:hypothetical protein
VGLSSSSEALAAVSKAVAIGRDLVEDIPGEVLITSADEIGNSAETS